MRERTTFDDPASLENQLAEGAEEVLGERVFFHKRVRLPKGVDWLTASGFIRLVDGTAVAHDNKQLPPGTEVIADFEEGDQIGQPYIGTDGRKYVRVHDHQSHSSTGGIPDKQRRSR